MSVIVIGGGIAGLAAAHRIARSGVKVTVLEASSRLGGMIAPLELAGQVIDGGAEAYARRLGIVDQLCETLNLPVAAPAGQPHIRWDAERLWPAADGVLGIPASPEDPALLAALGPDELRVAWADQELAPEVGADAVTVGELVAARMGRAVVDRLVAPLTRGVYGLPPERIPVAQFAPKLAGPGSLFAKVAAARGAKSSVAQPVGGMYRLVAALAEAIRDHGGQIHLGQRPLGIEQGWRVYTETGTWQASRLVLACPAAPALELLRGFGVAVSAPATNPALSAMLALEPELLGDEPVGSGLLLGQPLPGVQAKALTHYTAKWPWSRGGAEVLRLAYPSDSRPDRERCLADAEALVGRALPRALDFALVRWPEVPRSLTPAQREALDQALPEGLRVAGAWVAGNGIEAAVASGFEAT